MGIFSKKKVQETQDTDRRVKILGSGCARCNRLEGATVKALQELGMETEVDHVREYDQIMAYGVISLPALVVDGAVVSAGKVLTVQEARQILSEKLT